jgi:hypothetical protein
MKFSALRLAAAMLAVAYSGGRAVANDFDQSGGVVYDGAAAGYGGAAPQFAGAAPGYAGAGIGYAGPGYGPGMVGPGRSLFTSFPNYAPWGGYGYGNRHEKWGCCAGIWDGYCNQGSNGWGGGCGPRKVCHRRRALGRGAGPYIDSACCGGGNAAGGYGAGGYGAGGCSTGNCGAAQPACGSGAACAPTGGCRLRQRMMQRRMARSLPVAAGYGYANDAGYTLTDGAAAAQQPQPTEPLQSPPADEQPSPMPPEGNST